MKLGNKIVDWNKYVELKQKNINNKFLPLKQTVTSESDSLKNWLF